jgi:hypothetical protein
MHTRPGVSMSRSPSNSVWQRASGAGGGITVAQVPWPWPWQVLFTLNKDYKERVYRHEAGHLLLGSVPYSMKGTKMDSDDPLFLWP